MALEYNPRTISVLLSLNITDILGEGTSPLQAFLQQSPRSSRFPLWLDSLRSCYIIWIEWVWWFVKEDPHPVDPHVASRMG